VEEARAAHTRAEFVCKMAIASKEARDTRYRLRILLIDSGRVDGTLPNPLLSEATEVMKVIGAMTSEARRSLS
jgi:four helix bundle protein